MTITVDRSEREARRSAALAKLAKMDRRKGDTQAAKQFLEVSKQLLACELPTLVPLLPILFNLQGRPYTLQNHFPFEPLFHTNIPRKIVLKTGRQVGKSRSLASQGIALATCVPFFNTLFVTPLFEMIRRFSSIYIQELINQSPARSLWTDSKTNASVLQRTFTNNSSMFFSYAFLSAERTRGLAVAKTVYDEISLFDASFIPVIRETMSGSFYGDIEQYAGTPLSLDNILQRLWNQSSQAEWVVPCTVCHKENIPALGYDLDEMIGPWHENISEETPGTICAKCKRPVSPRNGFWLHAFPERIGQFSGYHVPQIIMPGHYANLEKWQTLVGKHEGLFGTTRTKFLNECMGESFDEGTKLITVSELQAAAVLHKNDIDIAAAKIHDYPRRVLSVDWGGGGVENTSFSKYAVLGMRGDGEIHCIYGEMSMTPHDHSREARLSLDLLAKFQCSHLVHDYCGAGAFREKFVIDAGFPIQRVVPVWYVSTASQSMFRYIPASETHPRDHFKCDKTRSLIITCAEIKNGRLKFFEYDYVDDDNPGLIADFLALAEEKLDARTGRDRYTITRIQSQSDDFAQAVNMGCCALWYMSGNWPNLALAEQYKPSQDLIELASPPAPQWY